MNEAKSDHDTLVAGAAPEPSSLQAFSLDSGSTRAKTTADVPAARQQVEAAQEHERGAHVEPTGHRVALRFKFVVGLAIGGCVAILVLAALQAPRSGLGTSSLSNANRASVTAPATVAPPSTSASPPEPSGPPAALPALGSANTPAASEAAQDATAAPASIDPMDPRAAGANRATIRLARPGKSLTIDGIASKTPSAIVSCGSHSVAVGTEKARRVDAPCGSTIVVDVGKATRAKEDGARSAGKTHAAPSKRR